MLANQAGFLRLIGGLRALNGRITRLHGLLIGALVGGILLQLVLGKLCLLAIEFVARLGRAIGILGLNGRRRQTKRQRAAQVKPVFRHRLNPSHAITNRHTLSQIGLKIVEIRLAATPPSPWSAGPQTI